MEETRWRKALVGTRLNKEQQNMDNNLFTMNNRDAPSSADNNRQSPPCRRQLIYKSKLVVLFLSLINLCFILHALSIIQMNEPVPNLFNGSHRNANAAPTNWNLPLRVHTVHIPPTKNTHDGGNHGYQHSCAKWIPTERKKILLVNFTPLRRLSWIHEEYHMSLSVIQSLAELGFEIYVIDRVSFENEHALGQLNLESYHRIFYMIDGKKEEQDTVDWSRSLFLNQRKIICKVRVLIPNSSIWEDPSFLQLSQNLHTKQILVATPHDDGTYLDYYPLLPKPSLRRKAMATGERGRVGTVVVWEWSAIMAAQTITSAFVEAGFVLHVLCIRCATDELSRKDKEENIHVYSHVNLSQDETLEFISQSTFVFWFQESGDLRHIPTPLSVIALSFGTAVLNMLNVGHDASQLPHLSRLGMPYVYNVDVRDAKNVLNAVERSVQYRFESHIMLRSGMMKDRLCALMEDDSICTCPSWRFGMNESETKKELEQSFGVDSVKIDCRSNFYMKKTTRWPDR